MNNSLRQLVVAYWLEYGREATLTWIQEAGLEVHHPDAFFDAIIEEVLARG